MVNRKGNTNSIIFLDFDGVMDTAYYDLYLTKHDMAEKDRFGVALDSNCVSNLAKIIENNDADNIVVSSTLKYFMLKDEKSLKIRKKLFAISNKNN